MAFIQSRLQLSKPKNMEMCYQLLSLLLQSPSHFRRCHHWFHSARASCSDYLLQKKACAWNQANHPKTKRMEMHDSKHVKSDWCTTTMPQEWLRQAICVWLRDRGDKNHQLLLRRQEHAYFQNKSLESVIVSRPSPVLWRPWPTYPYQRIDPSPHTP